MIKAVIDNLDEAKPKHNFTVGINDDVNFTSLEIKEHINTTPKGTIECIFWGLGSDGTIGANKAVVANIIKNTPLYASAYFNYDAYKTDGNILFFNYDNDF